MSTDCFLDLIEIISSLSSVICRIFILFRDKPPISRYRDVKNYIPISKFPFSTCGYFVHDQSSDAN